MTLTPEEWVRQHVIQFLIHEKAYSKSSVNAEVLVEVNGMNKRADLVVFKKEKPFITVECKAPSIIIKQETFDQIARYNLQLHAEFLMVTNGLSHYYCQMDFENRRYVFLKELPKS